MKNERDNSLLIGDSSFFKNKSNNETIISHLTKGSGEKDYIEYRFFWWFINNLIINRLESLINKELEDKANSNQFTFSYLFY